MGVALGSSMNKIGIIQGRITPSHGVIQKFPDDEWLDEFKIAQLIGFDFIEFLADASFNEKNPLWTGQNLDQVTLGLEVNKLSAYSLCVDHIMSRPLTHGEDNETEASYCDLLSIVKNAIEIGTRYCVLPFLEGASLRGDSFKLTQAQSVIHRLLADTQDSSIVFCLETDLPYEEHIQLIAPFGDRVGICYDTGNRTSFGFDPHQEILLFNAHIKHIHIKDKNKDGKNVLLSEGIVDFDAVFQSLAVINYAHAFTLETNRGENEEQTAKKHIVFLKNLITKYLISKD